jgi:hypothetical protein
VWNCEVARRDGDWRVSNCEVCDLATMRDSGRTAEAILTVGWETGDGVATSVEEVVLQYAGSEVSYLK